MSLLCLQILNVEKLHMMLLASSVEIVIYAYATSHKFPWVLECFNIDAFYFYKLIEVIVLNHEGILNRDLIKHLNAVSLNNLKKESHNLLFIDRSCNHFRWKSNVSSLWPGRHRPHCGYQLKSG